MTQFAEYTGQVTIGPSPAIWADCPVVEILNNASEGVEHHNDFLTLTDTTLVLDAGVVAPLSTTLLHGNIAAVTGAVAQDFAYLVFGNNLTAHFPLADTAGKKLWFEGRIKFLTVADMAVIFGLAGLGVDANIILNTGSILTDATGVLLATKPFVGFNSVVAAPTILRATYQAQSQTQQIAVATAHTMVADTFFKVGLKFDPADVEDKKIRYYINNLEVGSVTQAQLEAVTFPDNVLLTPIFGLKQNGGVVRSWTIDWWRVAQVR